MFSRRSMPRLSPTSAAGTSPSRPAGARYPNFDFIRLVAASSVIFSHAFQISEGTDENEPLVRLLGAHNIAGIYGVFIFFKRGPFAAIRVVLDASPEAKKRHHVALLCPRSQSAAEGNPR
jgi:hypothetical protein